MRRDDSLGFWPVPIAALGLAGIAWWTMRPVPTPDVARNKTPSIEARGARSIIVREDGQKAWQFSAERIAVAPDRIHTSLENIANGVIFQHGAPLWRLRARRADANQLTRDLEVHDVVASLVTEELRISAPRAVWKQKERTLSCPQQSSVTMKNISVRSSSVSYSAESGALRCDRGVEVSSRFGTLSAPAATAYPKSRRVEFHGGVNIVMHRAALIPSAKTENGQRQSGDGTMEN